jgi:formylglycine-generating enzyme required for sulfatase activity
MKPTPIKPTDNRLRVLRGGGCYYSTATGVRAAFRNDDTPSLRNDGVGFRCAQRGARMTLVKVTP